VRYQGESRQAVASEPVQRGREVMIEGIEGLTLQVRPLAQPAGDEQHRESNRLNQ
jgi:membrane-bound ClpP family serine protease